MEHILNLEQVKKYYGGNSGNITKAVDGISMYVDKGEFVAIMGASGSGKTTLLNCISTIDTVTSGHITVNNQDITKIKDKDFADFRRENLGFIFQDFNLLDTLTIGENISLSLVINKQNPTDIEKRVHAIADKLGIRDTQYIIGRHYDKEHPHVHIAFNRVDNNGRTISDRNDRYRSERICKELTRKYGLYFANGKEQVKMHRLKEPEKTRYEIYQVLKREVARCSDWTTLLKRLKAERIDVRFKYKGNTHEVQGIIFTKNGYHFNGSKIDRSFSYSKIDKALNGNNQAEYQREYEPHHMQISHFENKESELISGSLGLLDFTSSPDVDSQEEADFRRLMQQKPKKKRTRGFKL